jgi:glycosyltransferase involved in cell wall biosynthesis
MGAPELTCVSGEPAVAILLSTFNGERYLAEQLRSFNAQSHSN